MCRRGVLTNQDLEKMVDTNDEWILTRTGISERHIAAPEVATSDMAVEAAKIALEQRGVSAKELDAIIVCTVTPDMFFPATACLVQDRLGAQSRVGLRSGGGVLRLRLRDDDGGSSRNGGDS